jgi:integrase
VDDAALSVFRRVPAIVLPLLANLVGRGHRTLERMQTAMKERFRLFKRSWGTYYVEDVQTGKQDSLETKDKTEARRLWHAKNEAHYLTGFNLKMARVYLQASDPLAVERTWQYVMDQIIGERKDDVQRRWRVEMKRKAYDPIRKVRVVQTLAEHFLDVLKDPKVSTNVYLRRLHNYALDMNWLGWPVIPKRKWPKVVHAEKRSITFEEHEKVIAREFNPERKAFYELLWHLGASQSDLAHLHAEDVDWEDRTIAFNRQKTGSLALIHFGQEAAKVLEQLPKTGPLFPYLITVRSGDRATEFKQRCTLVGVSGVSLHCYRYAWAERAKIAGYPERFAQQALGHNSKAVHRAYAKKAVVKIPSLEDYEEAQKQKKLVTVRFAANG